MFLDVFASLSENRLSKLLTDYQCNDFTEMMHQQCNAVMDMIDQLPMDCLRESSQHLLIHNKAAALAQNPEHFLFPMRITVTT